jgi:predicted MFS family arabinose efflux permease
MTAALLHFNFPDSGLPAVTIALVLLSHIISRKQYMAWPSASCPVPSAPNDASMKTQLSRTQVLIMAITAGVCVANVYYAQPILGAIARATGLSLDEAGRLPVLSQAGYGIGLFFLTPIGDRMDRRRLILILQSLLIASLLMLAFGGGLAVLYAGSLLIGVFAVVAQVVLPMAASLVTENRGRVVSVIFTGLLTGILVARVFSGFITEWLGWRYVYGISAGLVLVTAILMQTDFPSSTERFAGSYAKLLRSTLAQIARFSLLRISATIGALAFGTLSAFWITLSFRLGGAPFHYGVAQIGLFGLLAAASALAAPLFGKMADKAKAANTLLLTTSMIVAGVACLLLKQDSIIPVFVAVVLLDIGVQATQVTNIALIYSLDATANSRINTVYMTSYFIGGSLGAGLSLYAWKSAGWNGAILLMLILSALAVTTTLIFRRKLLR